MTNTDKKSYKSFFYKGTIIITLFLFCDYQVFQLLYSGITQYFNFDRPADILCVGHSHSVLGIDAKKLENKTNRAVTKYALAGANTLDRYWMVKHYLSINPDVSTVVYDVDARLFDTEGLSSASYTLFLPFIDNPIMSKYLAESASWEEYYTSKYIRTSRFRDQSLMISLRGLFNKKESKKIIQLRVEDHEHYLEQERQRKIQVNKESVEIFLKTINELTQQGIQVVLLNIPVADVLNQIEPERQQSVLNLFETVAYENTNVFFLDYHQEFEHSYELFWDLSHLNEEGKNSITNKLAEDLKKIFAFQVRSVGNS